MEELDEPYLADMWLLEKLVKRDYKCMLFSRLLDNGDVVLTLTQFLDIQSLLNMLAVKHWLNKVNHQARTVEQLAVIEVRLLKQKISVMESTYIPRMGIPSRLEMIEYYQNYSPAIKFQVKAKRQQAQQLRRKL